MNEPDRADESTLAPSQRAWCQQANENAGLDLAQIRLMPGMDDGR